MPINDTIAAIATPPGEGGIGIIRISGPEAPAIAEKIWQGPCAVAEMESHKMYYGEIVDGNHILDYSLIVWMRAPRSYTGEEVIEIQAHGGPVLLEEILQSVLAQGARLARPGEFTERAFLNGKMDLTQAEGVADLIGAESECALTLAQDQLTGHLKREIERIRKELVVMRAQLEAMIDFPEDEDVSLLRHDEVAERVGHVSGEIKTWLASYDEGRRQREGVRVVIAGRPNVGKSSLLNALIGDERVIVHHQAGTTRDTVDAAIQLKGLLIRLYDTAGLREGEGDVEAEGIRRSWQEVERADLVLFVIDRSEALTDEDRRIYEQISSKAHCVVLNKCDLSAATGPVPKEETLVRQDSRLVSAKTGEGIPALKQAITHFALPHGRASDQLTIANLRHKLCLEKTVEALKEVKKSADQAASLELIAADLMVAANHLGEITGEITHDEVLSEIFSRFCLGK